MKSARLRRCSAILFAVISASLIVGGASAPAALQRVAQSSTYVSFVAVDGDSVYWVDEKSVHRTDLTSGLSSEIFKQPGNGYVLDFAAAYGRVAMNVSGTRRDRILVGPALGPYREVANSSDPNLGRKFCGSNLALGNITPNGSLIFSNTIATTKARSCRRKQQYRTIVMQSDPETDPNFPPAPIVLANSKITFSVRPQLFGQQLIVQDGSTIRLIDLATGKSIRKKAKRNWTAFADFDSFGNVLVSDVEPGGSLASAWMLSAAENYSTKHKLNSKLRAPFYTACGNYLLLALYGKSSQLDRLPNPFAPEQSAPRSIVPRTTTQLGPVGCSSSRAALVTTRGIHSTIWIDELTG